MKKGVIATIISAILIVCDQLTKYLAVTYLKGHSDIPILGDLLTLHYLENTGAAFGILNNQRLFFIILTVIFCCIFIYVFFKIPNKPRYRILSFLVLLIFSGAVGNFIDRIIHGFVVDFLYIKIINFPVFNVADIYITMSCIVMVIIFLFVYKDEDWDIIFKAK